MNVKYEIAQLKRPIQTLPENSVCGDETILLENSEYIFLAVFDGAGHGQSAFNISQKAKNIIQRLAFTTALEDLINNLHNELRGTIGGVVAICKINKDTSICTCSAVGNISIKIFPPQEKMLMSYGGILGYEITKPKINTRKLSPGDIIILHSDGINTNFNADEIIDFYNLSAKQLSGILIDYFSKTLDDASVIIVKVQHG